MGASERAEKVVANHRHLLKRVAIHRVQRGVPQRRWKGKGDVVWMELL